MTVHIGFDIGGTNIRCISLKQGEIQNPIIRPVPDRLADLENAVFEMAMEQVRTSPKNKAELTLGIGCAGSIGRDGTILVSPNITYLNGVNLLECLVPKLEKYARLERALVENDAAASAYGEYCFGELSPDDKNDFLYVAFGTGIGAGRIIGGKLYTGANNYWGEVGHMQITEKDTGPCGCGSTGCWEQLAAGSAISRMANQKAPELAEAVSKSAISGRDIINLLEHDNLKIQRESSQILNEFSYWVAFGLKNLIAIEDPGCIVLGGGLMDMGDILLTAVVKNLPEIYRQNYQLKAASCPEFGGVMGAAELARIQ